MRLLLIVPVTILLAGQGAVPAPSGVEGSPVAALADELAKFRIERSPMLRLRQGLNGRAPARSVTGPVAA